MKCVGSEGAEVEVFTLSEPGRVRPNNEDVATVEPLPTGKFLVAIADGMGGHERGEIAAQTSVDVVVAYVKAEAGRLGDLPLVGDAEGERRWLELLEEGVRLANAHVFELAGKWEGRMGTTVDVALVDASGGVGVHVGDGRVYLFRRGNETLERLTDDHSYVFTLYKEGHLAYEALREHPQRHIILRAVGAEAHVTPDPMRFTWRKGDRLLFCTDGLTQHVNDGEIAAILGASAKLNVAGDELVGLALSRGGTDNVTVVLLQAGEEDER